jgi:hypothetical protein
LAVAKVKVGFVMPTDNNMNVAKTPIFQRFYEKCSLVVRRVQPRSPFPKIIWNLGVFGCEQVFRRVFRIRQGTRAA